MTETELYRGGIWIRRVKWSALLLLIGLILLVFLLNLGSLNGDDLRRFAARVSFGLHGQALIEDGRISYLDDESRQAALFKDGLAIVANDKLKIYDSTGLEFFSTSAVMLNPVLQTTPKQVLVFDRGDGSLQVYNSFDQVFALELEEPIINASLNDSGALIVAHKAEGYKSQLTLYDTGFNERYKWYSAGSYLLDVDVYGNCKQFAAAGITLGESQVQCEILLFDANDTAPYKRIPIDAAFVYDIKYMNKDSLRVITDTGWYLIDTATGDFLQLSQYSRASLLHYDASADRMAFVFAGDRRGRSTLSLTETATGSAVTVEISGTVLDVACHNSYTAVLTDRSLLCYSNMGELISESAVESGEQGVLAADGQYVVLTGKRHARYVKIS